VRAQQYRARGLHTLLKKGKAAPKAKAARAAKPEERVVSVYRESVPAPSRRGTKHAAKPKADLVPGAVLILLAGKYRGKRVVLLAVLPSGLLLVSGPYRLNGEACHTRV
jgi:large subunit ribosomal protein L6e